MFQLWAHGSSGKRSRAGLEADWRLGVLEEVPANTPVEWMSRMITPSKKNGESRPTVDLSDLNKACKRQTHHTKSPYHLASEVPKNMKKTFFDAWNRFHSLELETKSRPYTKFITPWGTYQYKTCRVLKGGWHHQMHIQRGLMTS